MVSCTRNDDFHFLYKSFILAILDHFGLHLGRFWASKLTHFGIKKSIKMLINFWIVVLSILEPFCTLKWLQNRPFRVRIIDPRALFCHLGPRYVPRRLKRPKKASKSTLRDLIFDVFGTLFWHFCCICCDFQHKANNKKQRKQTKQIAKNHLTNSKWPGGMRGAIK